MVHGYRLDRSGRYRTIEPDDQGRILSETTGLWFQISPDGRQVLLSRYPTGEPLLTREEEEELRKAAEEKARAESEARKAAEERARVEIEARKAAEEEATRTRVELVQLRAEFERLRRA